MSVFANIADRLKQRLFESVVKNNLVYNTCWEDPAIDRKLLEIDSGSRIVTITSAGCNALNYLLDQPAKVHCVDINPAQNALLELKRALFRHGNYSVLWQMFGNGQYAGASVLYQRVFNDLMSTSACHFWDQHIDYFSPYATRGSLYYRGTTGLFAYLIQKRLRQKNLRPSVDHLLDACSLKEQQYYYNEIEPHLWNAFSRWLLKRPSTLALLGVPYGQRNMIEDRVRLSDFIRTSLKDVFTQKSLQNNYFWQVYLTGSYSRDCCPNYLKEKYFKALSTAVSRLDLYSCSLLHFLQKFPGRYTHFNLLDHQDWMVQNEQQKLEKEWYLILNNAAPGAKILFRSAGTSRSFVPKFVHQHLDFNDQKAHQLHKEDRVGTYGSTHLAIVKNPL